MNNRFLFITLAVLMISFPAITWGKGYSNPVLKILLLQTSKSVQISSQTDMTVNGVYLEGKRTGWIAVKKRADGYLQLDDSWQVSGSAFFKSNSPIAVKRSETNTRRYLGIIEVRPYAKGVTVINHVRTEAYLDGVLNAEISTNWPIEVVKAQSIISRTFALYQREQKIDQPWHLKSNFHDQVYKGIDIADERGRFAITTTAGLVVCHDGKLAQTFYHSNSGGTTEDPGNLWRTSLPYLTVKTVPYGESDPRYHWNAKFTAGEINQIVRKAGLRINSIRDVVIASRNSSNRVNEIIIVGDTRQKITGNNFRKLAGYRRVKSLLFDISKQSDGYYVTGRGNGHGVGLSQWGAKEMAEAGYGYDAILSFFYTGIDILQYQNN